MRLRVSLLAAVALAAPAPASAATVSAPRAQEGQVQFEAAPGEANDVSLGAPRDGTPVTVRDAGATLTPGPGCRSVNANEVLCDASEAYTWVRIRLGDGNDRFTAEDSHRADVEGGPGDDQIAGAGQNDRLDGGPGRDVVSGADGHDSVRDADADADVLDGGAGEFDGISIDRPAGTTVDMRTRHTVEGDVFTGFEDLSGGDGPDVLVGDDGPNRIFGGPGDDRLEGAGGDDDLSGDDGDDRVLGGDGDDELEGGRGDDRVEGGRGNDALFLLRGVDELFGGAGRDRMVLRRDRRMARVHCGAGRDRVTGMDRADRADGCERLGAAGPHRSVAMVPGRARVRGHSVRLRVTFPTLSAGPPVRLVARLELTSRDGRRLGESGPVPMRQGAPRTISVALVKRPPRWAWVRVREAAGGFRLVYEPVRVQILR